MINRLLSTVRQQRAYYFSKQYIKVALRRLPSLSGFDIVRKPIVLIHQMGKVGSLSIYHSLQAAQSHQFDIYHTHFLNPRYALASDTQRRDTGWQIYKQSQNKNWLPIDYYDITRIHNQLLVKSQHPLNIITMVRDPISRNISAYFQNLHWIWGIPDAHQQKSLHELAQGFWAQANHDFPIDWLDQEIGNVVGLDVYAHPFPHDVGVQHLRTGVHNVLIMHMRASDQIKEHAVQQFLGIEHFRMTRSHVSQNKPYGSVYKKFLSEVEMPEWYVYKMLNSRFARHFFSEDERQKRIAYWLSHPRT